MFTERKLKYGQQLFDQTIFALDNKSETFVLRPAIERKIGSGFLEPVILTMSLEEAERMGYRTLSAQEVLEFSDNGVNKPLFTMRLAEELVANS